MKWQWFISPTFLWWKLFFEIYPKLKKSPPESHFDPTMTPSPYMTNFWFLAIFGDFWPFLAIFGIFGIAIFSIFLNFYFHVENRILLETARRDRAENDEIRHFGGIWGSKNWVTRKNIDFVDLGGPRKNFQKVFWTSDSARTRRVMSKNMYFYPPRWHMTPPLTPGISPP